MVIAIDGPAGAGKSTVARTVAERLGFTYLDSGAMYRCVALQALRDGTPPTDGAALGEIASRIQIALGDGRVDLDGEDVSEAIRDPAVSGMASQVAAVPEVREALVARQRELIERGRYVAEGRDIGTVVSPDAPLKVFLNASDEERARRRAIETGEDPAAVAVAMADRDARDVGRDHSPLQLADDAIELDSTELSIDSVVDRIVELARERGLG